MKVFYEVWTPPLMTAGSTTWINDVISKAGGVNIFANETDQFPTVASETVVALNPDAIFLPTEMGQTPFYGSVAQVEAHTWMEHNQRSAKQPSLRNRRRFVRRSRSKSC